MAKAAFGWLASLMGTAILVWCGYCLFAPNEYFRWRLVDVPRLAVPLAMVWVGWRWIRGGARKGGGYATEITISLKLSGPDFGTEPERETILDLKHLLEEKLQAEQLGEIDGEEFGDGECSIFVHTNSPEEAETVVRRFLTAETRSLGYALARSEL
jgi:hypothetical protein